MFKKVTTSFMIIGCLCLVACGNMGNQASQEPESSDLASALDIPEVDRNAYQNIHAIFDEQKQIVETPLSRYVHSEDEFTMIITANFFPFKQCVNNAGYETSRHTYQTEYRPHIPYAVWSYPFAEKYGYDINPVQGKVYLDQGETDENPERNKVQSDCLEKTQGDEIPVIMRGVSARPVGDMVILSEVSQQVQTLMTQDTDVNSAVQEWIQCLEGQGIPMDTTYEQPIPVIPEEKEANIKQALVDVQCKKDVRLMERYYDAQAQYEQALIEKNQAAFNTLGERKEEYVNQAKQVLLQNGITP